MPTLYATFENAVDAERAAGALFDHGIARRDLTITSKRVSHVHAESSREDAAQLNGENEGWPPLKATASLAEESALIDDQADADESYQEADNAERSAKSGVSVTTPRDVMAGALKGAVVGLGTAVFLSLASMLPPIAVASLGGLAFAAKLVVLGIVVGALCGAALGLLTDQSVAHKQVDRCAIATGKPGAAQDTTGRAVLLAVNVSLSEPLLAEARRLVCKYHASSIDMS